MKQDKIVVELGDKAYVLSHTPFDENIDMDELTMIHYDNLVGEIITIPTLMNRVGILKADADNNFREVSLNHKILEAEKSEFYRKKLTTDDGQKSKSPTVAQVENSVTMDTVVIDSKMMLFKAQKQAEVIDSLYWAVKAKQQKINHISESVTPEDFQNEILEGAINGIMVKKLERKF